MRKLLSSLWFLGLSTLIAFPLLAWPILYFSNRNFLAVIQLPEQHIFSIPLFLAAGIVFGLVVIWLSELPFFEKVLADYKNILGGFQINWGHAFFLSVCAGVGEEVFFRGALQPLLGVWVTAIFFVAIHRYYSVKQWRKTFFGILLTLFIVLLGWSAEKYSLWHAIAGHFSYDFVLLMYLQYNKSSYA